MITKIFFVFGAFGLTIQTLKAAPAPSEETVGTGNVLVSAAEQKGDNVEQRPLNAYDHPLFSASETTTPTDANQGQLTTEVSNGSQPSPSVTPQMQETAPLKGSSDMISSEQLLSSYEDIEAMDLLQSLMNEIRKQEELMNSILSQFTGSTMGFPSSFPGGRFPSFSSMASPMPSFPKIDPSKMQLVDEQTINDENVEGKVQTYTSKPDPNTNAVMKKATYKTKDGNGFVQTMSSTSSSSYPPTKTAMKSNWPAMSSGLRLPSLGLTPPSIQFY